MGDDAIHPHGRFHDLVFVHALVGFTYQHQVREQQAFHVHLNYMGIHYLCTAGPVCNMSSWVVKNIFLVVRKHGVTMWYWFICYSYKWNYIVLRSVLTFLKSNKPKCIKPRFLILHIHLWRHWYSFIWRGNFLQSQHKHKTLTVVS